MKFILVLLLVSSSAFADDKLHVEIGIGNNYYRRPVNGMWWQDHIGMNQFESSKQSYYAGLTGTYDTGLLWRFGYTYFGMLVSHATATPDDAQYDLATKSCVGPCPDLATFNVSNKTVGLTYEVMPRLTEHVYLDVGATMLQHQVTYTIQNPATSQQCAVQNQCNIGGGIIDYQIKPIIGIEWREDKWSMGVAAQWAKLLYSYNRYLTYQSSCGTQKDTDCPKAIPPNYGDVIIEITAKYLF